MKKLIVFLSLFLIMSGFVMAQNTAERIKNDIEKLEKLREKHDSYSDTLYYFIYNKLSNSNLPADERALWHCYMSKFLAHYLQMNYFKIIDRTEVVSDENLEFSTWGIQKISSEMIGHALKSVENKEFLQKKDIKGYLTLMSKYNESRLKREDIDSFVVYRPTLYDCLAQEAISLFEGDISDQLPLPTIAFSIDDKAFFAADREFAALKIETPDTLSLDYHVMKIYQELTKFHLNSGYKLARLKVALQRLAFVKVHSTLDNSNKLYFNSLLELEKEFEKKDGYAEICYEIGEFYNQHLKNDMEDDEDRGHLRKAEEWYSKAVAFDPKSVAGVNADIKLYNLKSQSIVIRMPESVTSQNNLISYEYRNCNSIYCRILPLSSSEYSKLYRSVDYNDRQLYSKLVQLKYLKEWKNNLTNPGDYCSHIVDGILPALEPGEYTIIASESDFSAPQPAGFVHKTFKVSNIGALDKYDRDNYEEMLFYNLVTGEPYQNKKVDVEFKKYMNEPGEKKKFATDANGVVRIPKLSDYYYMNVELKDGKDVYNDSHYYSHYYNGYFENIVAHIYTDRAIYRPGQKIYFKVILVNSKVRHTEAVANDKLQVTLYDANGQVVKTQDMTTNEFGSCNGVFDVPVGVLTGNYKIAVVSLKSKGAGTKWLSVEEYKRPQFEVTVNAPAKDYRINEKVEITGTAKSYAGYPLGDAKVKYSVTREAKYSYWWWWRQQPSEPEQHIVDGSVTTDADGNFSFDFRAAATAKSCKGYCMYNFVVTVDVTDINGETHSAKQTVVVGEKAMLLSVDVQEIIDSEKDSVSLPVSATNLNGSPQVVDVEYVVERLTMPAQFLHVRPNYTPDLPSEDSLKITEAFPYLALNEEDVYANWKSAEVVMRGTLKTEPTAAINIPDLKKMKEGAYKITVSSKDKYGEKVSFETCFYIQSSKSKRSSVFSALSLQADKSTAQPGDVVTVTIGSYLNVANVYLEVMANDTMLYTKWLVLKRGQTQCEIPVTEDMRGSITVAAFLADNGFSYMETEHINVPFLNKNIEFEWGAFRDKTQPGSEETVELKLKGLGGEKLAAEMLCTMYDAALDAFRPNSLNLILDYLNISKKYPFTAPRTLRYDASEYENFVNNYKSLAYYVFYKLESGFVWERQLYRKGYYMLAGAVKERDGDILEAPLLRAGNDVAELVEEADYEVVQTYEKSSGKDAEQETIDTAELRSDFAETAFFYPDLKTDAEGNVVLTFKMPETLTKWKMLGLAHTTDMKVGTFEKFIQTAKDLMVVPNVPRFMREGDKMRFSAKIVNSSNVQLSGKISVEFYNALDNSKLDIVDGETTHSFSVEAGKSGEVSFNVVVPKGVPAVTYRILARSEKVDGVTYTDGESATLPVLSNRMLVTETLNLYVNGKQTKHFDFKPLDNYLKGLAPKTREHYNLKLELTPNPMWYAVQALPYLMQYPYDCNEQMFSKMYANSLAAQIANSSPDIKKAFEAWKNENPDELCSNLEKNEDLKYAVLEETPWVLDAQNESSQKYLIGNLFDVKRIEKENAQIIRKLEKNQNGDGSWSWFSNGYPSRFITQHIVAGSGHLSVLGVDDFNNMLPDRSLKKAVSFMDNELTIGYNQLKKYKEDMSKIFPSNFEIHHFYARSFFINKFKISKSDREAYDFYLNQMKKNWSNESIYMQAMIALVMYRNGDDKLANTIIKSLKNRALYSEELGMYWKREGSGWFWYEAPIERQSLLIEAFLTITNDIESVEKMQLWLLKQKQTQNWGTTKNTAEACYALFMRNGLKVKEMKQGEPVSVSLLDTVIVVEDDPATPTVMQTVPMNENAQVKCTGVTLAKSDEGSAWGGLYWQYFDNMENIEATDKNLPLSMVKQLYKVQIGDRGEVLVPITPKNPIRVGDKVRVRVELRADRDFEFVHLKDVRAATFEPTDVFSGYRRQGNMYYYESVRDASVNFFFDYLRKGTYVFEYTLVATQSGEFSGGISTVQCMYAPQFAAHSKGIVVSVEK